MRQLVRASTPAPASKPHIGVLIDASFGYGRAVLRGILRYARSHGSWKLLANLHGDRWPYPWDTLHMHGVIGTMWERQLDQRLHALGVPVINVSSARQPQPFVGVWPDNTGIGRMAAMDLLHRGFRQFAYFSDHLVGWSADREFGFTATIRQAGFDCHVFHPNPSSDGVPFNPFSGLHAWVGSLPKPIGVFCGDEYQAWTFIGTCQDVRVDVPEEVAVIAGGNDDLVCEACDVPLSSIDFGSERVGYEAAALLDRIMRGEAPPAEPTLIPPSHVVTRRSSDVLAIEDRTLAIAVRFISEHACDPLTVQGLLRRLQHVNRRWLERQFRQVLGRTVHDEIMRVRLERARQLLIDTDLKLEQIAQRCGFPTGQHFGATFRKILGTTPASFRRTLRTG